MQVTRENLSLVYADFKRELAKCDFVAMDQEMCGIRKSGKDVFRSQTPVEAWQTPYHAARTYIAFQVGLCLCRVKRDGSGSSSTNAPSSSSAGQNGETESPNSPQPNNNQSNFIMQQQRSQSIISGVNGSTLDDVDGGGGNNNAASPAAEISLQNATNRLEVRPYNFWLRQHGRASTDVALNMDSIDFLSGNGMDFSTWLNQGMEFCNLSQADSHRHKILPICFPPNAKQVAVQFCTYLRKIVEQWYISCGNQLLTHNSNSSTNTVNNASARITLGTASSNCSSGAGPLIDIVDLISVPFVYDESSDKSNGNGNKNQGNNNSNNAKSKNVIKKEKRKKHNQQHQNATSNAETPKSGDADGNEPGAFQEGQKEESSSSATTESSLHHSTRRILQIPSSSSSSSPSSSSIKSHLQLTPDNSFDIVAASPDGLLVAGGDARGNVFIWSYFNLRCISNVQQQISALTIPDKISIYKAPVTALCFPPNSSFIAVGYENSLVAIFEISSSFNLVQSFWMSRTMQQKSNSLGGGKSSNSNSSGGNNNNNIINNMLSNALHGNPGFNSATTSFSNVELIQQQFKNQLVSDDIVSSSSKSGGGSVAALQFDKRGLMLTIATAESTLAVWDMIRAAFVVPPLKKKLKPQSLSGHVAFGGGSMCSPTNNNDSANQETNNNTNNNNGDDDHASSSPSANSSRRRRSSSAHNYSNSSNGSLQVLSQEQELLLSNRGSKTMLIFSTDGNQVALCEGNFVRRFRSGSLTEIGDPNIEGTSSNNNNNNNNNHGGGDQNLSVNTESPSLILLTDKLIAACSDFGHQHSQDPQQQQKNSASKSPSSPQSKLHIQSSSIVVSPNGKLAAGVVAAKPTQQQSSSSSPSIVMLIAVWEVNVFSSTQNHQHHPHLAYRSSSPKSLDQSHVAILEIPCVNTSMMNNNNHNNNNGSSRSATSQQLLLLSSATLSFSGDSQRLAVSLTTPSLKPLLRGIFNEATSASTIFMFDLTNAGGTLVSVLNPEEELSIESVREARKYFQQQEQNQMLRSVGLSSSNSSSSSRTIVYIVDPQPQPTTSFTFFHNKNGHYNIVACYPSQSSAAHFSGVSVWELQQLQHQDSQHQLNHSEENGSSSSCLLSPTPFNGGVVSISQDSISILLCENPKPGSDIVGMITSDMLFSTSHATANKNASQNNQIKNAAAAATTPSSPHQHQHQPIKLDVEFEKKEPTSKLYTFKRMQPGYRDQIIREKQEELTERLGFRLFFEALKDSGKPLVGHHFVSDLAFFINQHEYPLKEDFAWFKKTVHSMFPSVFDTKAIAMRYLASSASSSQSCCDTSQQQQQQTQTGGSIGLEDLFHLRQGNRSTFVDIQLPMAFLSYHRPENNNSNAKPSSSSSSSSSSSAIAHQGAYDAMMTGVVFWSFLLEHKETLISEMENAIAFFGINYWMNLGSNYDFLAWCQVVVVEHPTETFTNRNHILDFLEINCPGVVEAVPGSCVQFIKTSSTFNIVIRPHAQGSVIEEMCRQLEMAGFNKPSQASGKVSSVSFGAAQQKAAGGGSSTLAINNNSNNNSNDNNNNQSQQNQRNNKKSQPSRFSNNPNHYKDASALSSSNNNDEAVQQHQQQQRNRSVSPSAAEKKSRKQKRLDSQSEELLQANK